MYKKTETHHHGIHEDGLQVVKEGFVVEGVGRLQDDRGKQEVEEQVRGELGEITVKISVFYQESPEDTNNHQQTEIFSSI